MIIQTDFWKTDVFAELVQGDFWKKNDDLPPLNSVREKYVIYLIIDLHLYTGT